VFLNPCRRFDSRRRHNLFEIITNRYFFNFIRQIKPYGPSACKVNIFDCFYHRDRTHDSKMGYSGLGLAIAMRMLELHLKSIIVDSKAGSGTTFTFFLPIYRPA
jgi:hypothetical protein